MISDKAGQYLVDLAKEAIKQYLKTGEISLEEEKESSEEVSE